MAEPTMKDERTIARETWDRYQYGRQRGHDSYVPKAKRLEEFYLGAGRQWSDNDRRKVEASGRPCIEINTIFPAVNTAIGDQLKSRADISYRPRNNQTDDAIADTLTKITRQICDDIGYVWLESAVFCDGLIQQRGFIDLSMSFQDNALGEVAGMVLDPLDCIPDPDANGYDPETWGDFIRLRWMTLDEIGQIYGQKKARQIENSGESSAESSEQADDRNAFGDSDTNTIGSTWVQGAITRYMVIDRQHYRYEMTKVVVTADGDIQPCDRFTEVELSRMVDEGAMLTSRIIKRVRWTVSTEAVLLFDDWSPYRTISVVPYFPYFRRGKTLGMVDNAVSPQELLNKTTSQVLHIVNTSANSGWLVEENSLVNMRTTDLERQGAKTGVVIEYKKGAQPPSKIQSNQVPTGLDRIAEKAEMFIKTITGMNDAQQGMDGNETSGIAIQSKQFQGKTQMAGPLDNLARTRNMVGRKLLELIQDFYTEERTFMITDSSDPTQTVYNPLTVNQFLPDGTVLNHIAVGKYDVVVTDMPTMATFEDNQFRQSLEMRKMGIGIPDSFVVESSTLTRKNDIVKALQNTGDPLTEARAKEIEAKIRNLDAVTDRVMVERVNKAVEAQYSAMQAANVAATTPQTAPIADAMLGSAGFEDRNAAPIIPQQMGGAPTDTGMRVQQNTNPLTPANPGVGLNSGIETPQNDMM
jgi:hypothetical protein